MFSFFKTFFFFGKFRYLQGLSGSEVGPEVKLPMFYTPIDEVDISVEVRKEFNKKIFFRSICCVDWQNISNILFLLYYGFSPIKCVAWIFLIKFRKISFLLLFSPIRCAASSSSTRSALPPPLPPPPGQWLGAGSNLDGRSPSPRPSRSTRTSSPMSHQGMSVRIKQINRLIGLNRNYLSINRLKPK